MVTQSNSAYYHYTADLFDELPHCAHAGSTAYVTSTGKHYIGADGMWKEVGVPTGSIVLWQESQPVPVGWVECDGEEGRPDVNVAGEPSLIAIMKV